MFEKIRDYEIILIIGIITLVCLDEENHKLNIFELECELNKKTKLYIINNLNGVFPLKNLYKIIELIDNGFAIAAFKKIINLINRLSYNQLAINNKCIKKKNKFNMELLYKFISEKEGKWFKLSEFEEYFGINKKTAWKYLNNLYNNGYLIHNGKKANKARYCFTRENYNILHLNCNQHIKKLNKNRILPF